MSTPDHLWPARPEYLRRGTPVHAGHGHVSIDLRDVTARAHAAMAHTTVNSLTGTTLCSDDWRAFIGGSALYYRTVLRRMRSLDESVTVAEARAALEWAESVVDGVTP